MLSAKRRARAFRTAGALVWLLAVVLSGFGERLSLARGITVLLTDGDVLSRARVELRSSRKWDRKRAVETLANLNTKESWELVVRALADPKGEVADTAQLELCRIVDAKHLALLAGKRALRSRDVWVRKRAAEVFGRMHVPIPAKTLARAIEDREPEVRRAALWSVERRARRASSGDAKPMADDPARLLRAVLHRLAVDRDPAVRARALFALAAVDPAAARPVVRHELESKHAELRCAASSLVPELFPTGVVADGAGLLRPRVEDESRAVRVCVVDALARLGTRSAIMELLRYLEAEREGRILARVVEVLRSLSGRKHRRDVRPWRAWAEGLAADWRPVDQLNTRATDTVETSAIAIGGLSILSGRVAFLIDLSGSMWTVRADGRTQKEVVEEMLAQVFTQLDSETRFNVIPYTEQPRPWKSELMPAHAKNIRAALAFFGACDDRGTGNFWDAAMLACEDPAVDTLVVLTDGAPTGGRRHRLELMVPLFGEFDATRQIAVDSILINAPARLHRHWEELARITGGRSVALDL